MARRTKLEIDGRRVEFTNLDKVLYPSTGTTKADVLQYYTAVAPQLLEFAGWRPATLKRWVDGVGTEKAPHAGFFQKNLPDSAPSWVRRFTVEHSDHTNAYPLVNDLATLAWLSQIAALEIHTPQWRFGPRGGRRNPDRMVIDLDPGEGVDLKGCAAVACIVRDWMQAHGWEPVPVTSGSKGIHLYVTLDGSRTSDQVSAWAHDVAREIESEHRDLVVSDMAKRLRAGRVLIDWSQNNGSKTTVTPYSLRGRLRPTVAAPRTWSEIEAHDLRHLEFTDVMSRIESVQALWPVPLDAGAPSASFVIQEHEARRHHYDLRIEHAGVLVSWALPKGVPRDPKVNHLAIRTEDHSLESGSFEGTIARGEYGAGTVRHWDGGSCDVHKWREGEEVIATLHGRDGGGLGGSHAFALIHTGHVGDDDDHWLIHAMPDGPVPRHSGMPYRPMLATAADDGELRRGDWRYEMKWDGIRALCEVRRDAVIVWSRNGNDITGTFPDVVEALDGALGGRTGIVDGEIIAVDERGRPSFGVLQERLGASRSAVARAQRTPVHLMLFDVLEVDDRETMSLPYLSRREMLEQVVEESGRVHVPPSFETTLEDALAISDRNGLEGIVAKRADSRYRSGTRSRAWRKVKHESAQEVIIVGWVEGEAGGLGSLVLAVPTTGGSLRYAGRVGTGFTDSERSALLDAVAPLARSTPVVSGVARLARSGVHWTEPTLVGEVRFNEWTRTGSMRHPSWRGLRLDKSPADVEPPEGA